MTKVCTRFEACTLAKEFIPRPASVQLRPSHTAVIKKRRQERMYMPDDNFNSRSVWLLYTALYLRTVSRPVHWPAFNPVERTEQTVSQSQNERQRKECDDSSRLVHVKERNGSFLAQHHIARDIIESLVVFLASTYYEYVNFVMDTRLVSILEPMLLYST